MVPAQYGLANTSTGVLPWNKRGMKWEQSQPLKTLNQPLRVLHARHNAIHLLEEQRNEEDL